MASEPDRRPSCPTGHRPPTNLVAEADGKVVGFACVGVWRDDLDDAASGELWAIYVHPDYWGTGAGHALMTETMKRFRSQSLTTAYLWVLDDNALARRFYERQGWQADAVTKEENLGRAVIIERRYSITLKTQ